MHANKPATERVSEWVSEWMVSIRLAQNQLLPAFVFFCRCSANFELQKEILQMGWNNVIMEDLFSLSWKSKCWICSIVSEWRYLLHKTRKICQFWYRIHISSYWQRFMRFSIFGCVLKTHRLFSTACWMNVRELLLSHDSWMVEDPWPTSDTTRCHREFPLIFYEQLTSTHW